MTIPRAEWDFMPPIFDRDDFSEHFEAWSKELRDTIDNLTPGYDADTIGQMTIVYDGDFYRLDDFAEIVVSGKQAMVSLAGQSEVIPAIRAACGKNNLPCADKGETMTIKLPPMTTQIRKNKIKAANDCFKQYKGAKLDKMIDEEMKRVVGEYLDVYYEHHEAPDHGMIRMYLLQIKVYMLQYGKQQMEDLKKELARREKAMLKTPKK